MLKGRLIVLVEDDEIMGASLVQRLSLEGAEVRWHRQMARALPAIRTPRQPIDAVVCDIRLPDGTGEDLYQTLMRTTEPPPFLFITGQGEVNQAVRLIRSGAADYILKPFDVKAFLQKVALVVPARPSRSPFEQTGISPQARAVDRQAAEAVHLDTPVLIRGQRGLGKTRLGRLIHAASDRCAAPLIALDAVRAPVDSEALAAASEEAADGTLLIVEIGQLSERTQDRLSGLLRSASFRLLATDGASLQEKVLAGDFRADLCDLLAAHAITVPPLAERPEDAVWLARRMLETLNGDRKVGLAGATETAIRLHDWPGNGREVRARIVHALEAAEGPVILPAHMFPEQTAFPEVRPLSEVREAAERAHIAATLARTGGQIAETARLLRIARTTLWEKMQKLGL